MIESHEYAEMHELESLYYELIYNLIEFLKRIYVDNVTGIDIVVKYMINHNYLSNNPVIYNDLWKYPGSKIESKIIHLDKSGLLIPYGFALCRHIANFLHEIYSTLGYESSQLFVLNLVESIKIINPKFPNLTEKDYLKMNKCIKSFFEHFDEESSKDLHQIKDTDSVMYLFLIRQLSKYVKDTGNHVINIVLDNYNLIHIFDSTFNYLGEFDKNRIYMYNYNERLIQRMYLIRQQFSMLYGYNSFELLKHATYPIQYDLQYIGDFVTICAKREQDFKSFKAQNSCYFDGISDNVQKLARKLL